MQTIPCLAVLALFSTTISAKSPPTSKGATICLSIYDNAIAGAGSLLYWLAFAADTPCVDTGAPESQLNVANGKVIIGEDLCKIMSSNRHASIGTTELDFVDKGPSVRGYGCGAALVVNGKQYDGRPIRDKDGSLCGGACVNKIGNGAYTGLKVYENVVLDNPHSDNVNDQSYQVGQLPTDSNQDPTQGTHQDSTQVVASTQEVAPETEPENDG